MTGGSRAFAQSPLGSEAKILKASRAGPLVRKRIRAHADADRDVAAGADKATGERARGDGRGARQNRPHHDPATGNTKVQTDAVEDAGVIL